MYKSIQKFLLGFAALGMLAVVAGPGSKTANAVVAEISITDDIFFIYEPTPAVPDLLLSTSAELPLLVGSYTIGVNGPGFFEVFPGSDFPPVSFEFSLNPWGVDPGDGSPNPAAPGFSNPTFTHLDDPDLFVEFSVFEGLDGFDHEVFGFGFSVRPENGPDVASRLIAAGLPGGFDANFFLASSIVANVTVQPAAAVPLPAALPLMLTGLAAFGLLARRRKSRAA